MMIKIVYIVLTFFHHGQRYVLKVSKGPETSCSKNSGTEPYCMQVQSCGLGQASADKSPLAHKKDFFYTVPL